MDNEIFNPYRDEAEVKARSAFGALMRKTYLWMTFGLVITGLAAAYVAGNETLLSLIFSSRISFIVLILAELGLVWYLSARIMNMSFTKATIMFALYALLNGATLSVIFLAYSPTIIATTFFITAGTFAGMSLVGFIVRRDLSTMGRVCYMLLIGLIIATVVNMFIGSSAVDMFISYAGVAIFVGLTAYDTQKIKNLLSEHGDEVNESTQKLALLGSLTLYLDFINLFLYLLRIFGDRR